MTSQKNQELQSIDHAVRPGSMGSHANIFKDNKHLSIRAKDTTELASQYDMVMVFPMEGKQKPYTQSGECKYVLNEMKESGLETFCYLSMQEDEIFILVRAPLKVLRTYASETGFDMELDPDEIKKALQKGKKNKNTNRYDIFPTEINDDPKYSTFSPYEFIFGKFDSDIDENIYLHPDGKSPFTKLVRLKLLYFILKAPKNKNGCFIEINKLKLTKKITSIFPLHDRSITDQMVEYVWEWQCVPWNMPFEDYRQYFGEKMTLYYVFMGHYSRWLIIPSFIGFVFQLVVWGTVNFSHPVLPFFGVVICFWSIFMLEYWKQEQSTKALHWGMSEFEEDEPDRPEFLGEPIKSYINGGSTLYYPTDQQKNSLRVSFVVIQSFIILIVGVLASIYVLRFALETGPAAPYSSTIASFLNTVQITIFNMIYQEAAVLLTNNENHRTDTLYEDHLILKLFAFQFINSYASFFFLAFIAESLVRPPTDDDTNVGQCGAPSCMNPLSINLAIIFGTRLTVNNAIQIIMPYHNYQTKLKKETEGIDPETVLNITPAEKDFLLMNYDGLIENINLYADAAIQYGFSTLFVTALPIAPCLSFVSNYFKSKLNIWKTIKFYQRPVPLGAQDIGTWLSIFQFLSAASVITNGALICFTMNVLDDFGMAGRLWIFIGFQWTMFSAQYFSMICIDDVPEDVRTQIERMKFIEDKVILKVPDEDGNEGDEHTATLVEDHPATCFSPGGKYIVRAINFAGLPDVPIKPYPSNSIFSFSNKNPLSNNV